MLPFPRAAAIALLVLPLMASDSDCWGGGGGHGFVPEWYGGDEAVVGSTEEASGDDIAIDLYLDATTSMEGYVGQGTEYAEFLRALEASLVSQWGETDVRFYKFGTRVDSIGRDDYLAAREDAGFYRTPGVFERTNIDSVLVRTDADRVAVVVTDLFQDAGDTTALVEQVKTRVFGRGLSLAVLALESAFDGTVYDAPGGAYRYASTAGDPASYRPYYALVVGAPEQVERLVKTLDGTAGVSRGRSLLVTPYVVESFDIELTKPPGEPSKGINVASSDDGYRFVVREGFDGGVLKGVLRTTPRPGAPAVNPQRVTLAAFRRSESFPDSAATRDLSLSNLRADDGGIAFDLTLAVDGPPGRYSYLALFEVGPGDGLATPDWTRALSTTNPSATADPNKTLNLERLTADLVLAAATVRRPLVGRTVISVTKQ